MSVVPGYLYWAATDPMVQHPMKAGRIPRLSVAARWAADANNEGKIAVPGRTRNWIRRRPWQNRKMKDGDGQRRTSDGTDPGPRTSTLVFRAG